MPSRFRRRQTSHIYEAKVYNVVCIFACQSDVLLVYGAAQFTFWLPTAQCERKKFTIHLGDETRKRK